MKRIFIVLIVLLSFLVSCHKTYTIRDEGDKDVFADLSDSTFEVHFIDVGQADSALVLCDGKSMLIDGGNVHDSSLIYSYLKREEIETLDVVVATHAHEDHVGGLSGALNFADVEKVYCPVDEYDSKAFSGFKKQVEKKGCEITIPEPNTEFELGKATVKILACNAGEETNDTSIVLKVIFGNTSFLFTGDAEREAEKWMLDNGCDLKSTVLKVGHHGSANSTTYPFLREVMPEYAVISVGKNNDYGHPTDDALSRLRDADVEVLRTDLLGDIIFTSNGEEVTFITQKDTNSETEKNGEILEWVVNKNSKKFHTPFCSSVDDMKEENKLHLKATRESLINDGYSPCGVCKG